MPSTVEEQLAITPSVVRWARVRAGYTLDEAKKYFKKIEQWELGDARPTYRQLEVMADKFKCPVAVFFFPVPPIITPVQNSFRTLPAEDFEQIPRTVKAFLRKGQAMQLNLSELNDGKNPAGRLITRDLPASIDESLDALALRVRDFLGITLQEQIAQRSVEDAVEHWRDAFARAGIYAFKDAFHAQGFFGFCLYDSEFPIIYVNNSSAKTRQIFTLFHELAHLLFHTSGIDVDNDAFIDRLPDRDKRVEVICNAFAAKLLVPDGDFDQQLVGRAGNRDTAELLANRYKVSREVVYRRMLNRGLVSAAEYQAAATAWASQKNDQSAGGNYYYNQITYLGPRYIDLALARFHQGRFDDIRLSEYLNIKPRNLSTFEFTYEDTR
jgi:Zn-dependent peptidase ImmA (M78 family)